MMDLVKLNLGFHINVGAPEPVVVSSENDLFITFYVEREMEGPELYGNNSSMDDVLIAIKFINYLKYSFGIPGEETIQGHPYYKLGLYPYGFYELKNSDLIQQLENIAKSHPYYKPDKWLGYRHFILTFHDSMFECVAKGFEIKEDNASTKQKVTDVLNELSVKFPR